MLFVVLEIALELVPVGEDVLALSGSDSVFIVSVVLVVIGIDCVAPARVVP